MNQKLPLENAGDSATFTITEVRAVSTKFGNKIVFVGTDDTGAAVETPLISDVTADKQLERIDLDRTSAVGERLTFSRAPNPSGKPYWNLDVPKAGSAPTKRMVPQAVPAATQTQGNASLAQRREKVLSQYLILWDAVAMHMHNVCDQANITCDAAAIQSAAATVWISWKDKGIQPDGLDAVQVSEPVPQVKMPEPSGKRLPPPNVTVPPARPEDDDLPF